MMHHENLLTAPRSKCSATPPFPACIMLILKQNILATVEDQSRRVLNFFTDAENFAQLGSGARKAGRVPSMTGSRAPVVAGGNERGAHIGSLVSAGTGKTYASIRLVGIRTIRPKAGIASEGVPSPLVAISVGRSLQSECFQPRSLIA